MGKERLGRSGRGEGEEEGRGKGEGRGGGLHEMHLVHVTVRENDLTLQARLRQCQHALRQAIISGQCHARFRQH